MARSKPPAEAEREHLAVLGDDLGPRYSALFNEVAWLHLRWRQYRELFGTTPERIHILNEAASLFFRVVEDGLWEDTLLHLCRLTDPPKSAGRKNLTVQGLHQLISDSNLRDEVTSLVVAARSATAFARDWRNRRLAHIDLKLAIEQGAKPLEPASRQMVTMAIAALDRILNRISQHYFNSDLVLEPLTQGGNAVDLLYLLRDGLQHKKAGATPA